MRIVGITLFVIGILFGLLGVRSNLRDNANAKPSVVVKSFVKWAEVKLMSGKAVGSISFELSYIRDGVTDSIEYSFTEAYSNNDPLPTVEELKAALFYVRYVPKEKRSEKVHIWVFVSSNSEFDGMYGRTSFGQMFALILMGFLIKSWGPKKQTIQKSSP